MKLVRHIKAAVPLSADSAASSAASRRTAGSGAAPTTVGGGASAVSAVQEPSSDVSPPHALSTTDITDLAAGYGGAQTVHRLFQSQQSLRRALLAAVYDAYASAPGAPLDDAGLPAAWEMLTRLDAEHPDAVDAVLAHPYVRVWAAHCLSLATKAGDGRGPMMGDAERPGWPAADLAYLAVVAVAAAARSGVSARLAVPVRDGAVYLPTLGRLDVGPAAAATVEVADGTVSLGPSPSPSPGRGDAWRPTPMLSAGGLTLALEAMDPYRDCHHWPAAGLLATADHDRWQRRLEDSWELIQRHHAGYAAGLAAGLTTIVPLSASADGRSRSSAVRHAFGAVAASLPDLATDLAIMLLHEFQHVKLGAVLDLFDLLDGEDVRLFQVGWRDYARPLEAVLQGAYAHLAVADVWRVRAQLVGHTAAGIASARFARVHGHLVEALDILDGCGSLTDLGSRFVTGMRATVTGWIDDPGSVTAR